MNYIFKSTKEKIVIKPEYIEPIEWNDKIVLNTGTLHFQTLSTSGDIIPNVSFKLEGEDILGNPYSVTATSDNLGMVLIEDIPEGRYILSEESVPEAYEKQDETWIVEVTWKLIHYHEGLQGEAYAVFDSSDNSLRFFRDEEGKYTSRQTEGTKTYYTGVESTKDLIDMPWSSKSINIQHVIFEDKIKPNSTGQWFYYMENLTDIVDIHKLDTSNVTSMDGMFFMCSALSSLDVSHFDTSQVNDMQSMFFGCNSLTHLDVSHFDTSKVTVMSSMFGDCFMLTSLDVSHFDTSKVTVMHYMFSGCGSLSSLGLSHFDTSNVVNMDGMFTYTTSLTTTLNIMKMPSSYDKMCFKTKNITLKYISPVTSANVDTLVATKSSTDPGVVNGGWGIFTSPTAPIPLEPLADEQLNIEKTAKHKITLENGQSNKDYKCKVLEDAVLEDSEAYAVFDSNDGSLVFFRDEVGKYTNNQTIGTKTYYTGIETSTETDPSNAPWHSIAASVQSVTFEDVMKPKSTAWWFSGMYNTNFTTINGLEKLDTSEVTNMQSMFGSSVYLTSLDVSHFDTNNVTSMSGMFFGCLGLTSLDLRHFDTSKVTNMGYMFLDCIKLTTTLNIMNMPSSYIRMCYRAESPGSTGTITLKYTSPVTSANIDTLVATKYTSDTLVMNGGQSTFTPPSPIPPILKHEITLNTDVNGRGQKIVDLEENDILDMKEIYNVPTWVHRFDAILKYQTGVEFIEPYQIEYTKKSDPEPEYTIYGGVHHRSYDPNEYYIIFFQDIKDKYSVGDVTEDDVTVWGVNLEENTEYISPSPYVPSEGIINGAYYSPHSALPAPDITPLGMAGWFSDMDLRNPLNLLYAVDTKYTTLSPNIFYNSTISASYIDLSWFSTICALFPIDGNYHQTMPVWISHYYTGHDSLFASGNIVDTYHYYDDSTPHGKFMYHTPSIFYLDIWRYMTPDISNYITEQNLKRDPVTRKNVCINQSTLRQALREDIRQYGVDQIYEQGVTLKYYGKMVDNSDTPVSNVPVDIYKLGDIKFDDDEVWVDWDVAINDEFQIYGSTTKDRFSVDVMDTYMPTWAVVNNAINAMTPYMQQTISDSNGVFRFNDLDMGIYAVVPDNSSTSNYRFSPHIVTIPQPRFARYEFDVGEMWVPDIF